jgi:hypothetical protein
VTAVRSLVAIRSAYENLGLAAANYVNGFEPRSGMRLKASLAERAPLELSGWGNSRRLRVVDNMRMPDRRT